MQVVRDQGQAGGFASGAWRGLGGVGASGQVAVRDAQDAAQLVAGGAGALQAVGEEGLGIGAAEAVEGLADLPGRARLAVGAGPGQAAIE